MRIVDVVLIAPIWDISGTAEVGRNLFFALHNLGIKVKIVDIPWWSHLKAELHPEQRELIEFGLSRNDIQDPVAIHFYPPDPFKGVMNVGARLNISYTVFETDKCPILWRDILNNQFQEVWVGCEFQREAYASQGVDKNKIRVINFGVDSQRFNPKLEPLNIENKTPFAFGTAFDWSVRKNPEGILAAFLQEFTNDPDVCLILKSYTGYGDEAAAEGLRREIKRMRAMLRSKARVVFMPNYLSADQIPNFHKSIDCWVNLSRGEGCDLGSLQSVSCGVPVVASDNSSHKVYLNSESSYLVPCVKQPIVNQEFLSKNPQFLGHSWWEPNVKDARKAMRQAYNDWKSGKIEEKKKSARENALMFPWQKTGVRMVYEAGKFFN